MYTVFLVADRTGQPLGVVRTIAALVRLVRANPGATYKSVAMIENPCALHPSFESDYCPTCGTATTMGDQS